MEYRASDKGEQIDQRSPGMADVSVIWGGKGNDHILFGNANVDGGAGDDTLESTGGWGAAVYWSAPAGVNVNLATGVATDGHGGVDKLVNVKSVHGSGHDDVLTGDGGDNSFFTGGGNNTVTGGAGYDTVNYFNVKSTDATIRFDAASDTFTVTIPGPNGTVTDRLQGIEAISFVGDASDKTTFYRDSHVPVAGFIRADATLTVAMPGAFLSQIKTGDFNGDGKGDWLAVAQVGTGTAPAPSFIYTGTGNGTFIDSSGKLLPNGSYNVSGGGRTLVADFNNDGRSDIVQLNFGNDAPPFPGGHNSLLLSAPDGTLKESSGLHQQKPELNHGGSYGDVNGDGYLDVLVNTLSSGNLLYINNGNGEFTLRNDLMPKGQHVPGNASVPYTHTQSALIDVNGDGAADLILGKWDNTTSTSASQVFLNNGKGDFSAQSAHLLPDSGIDQSIVLDIKSVDLNHDARPDLMLSVTNGGSAGNFYQTAHIQLLVNDGGGKFHDETAQRLAPAVQASFQGDSRQHGWIMALTEVDMNLDGHGDILVTSASDPVPSILLMNNGDGTFSRTWDSGKNGRTVVLDANSDGMMDLVTYYTNTNSAEVRLNVMGRSAQGGQGNDSFMSSAGSDSIDGGAGLDAVRYAGARNAYTVVRNSTDGASVTSSGMAPVTDTLRSVERLQFSDVTLAFDTDGLAGQAYRLYKAAFNRIPDSAGLGYWIGVMDQGMALRDVAGNFLHSSEFAGIYGAAYTNTEVVNRFYQNVLGRPAEKAGLDYWVNILDQKQASVAEVLSFISDSGENRLGVAKLIAEGIAYTPYQG